MNSGYTIRANFLLINSVEYRKTVDQSRCADAFAEVTRHTIRSPRCRYAATTLLRRPIAAWHLTGGVYFCRNWHAATLDLVAAFI